MEWEDVINILYGAAQDTDRATPLLRERQHANREARDPVAVRKTLRRQHRGDPAAA
jgi:hypothetical protein